MPNRSRSIGGASGSGGVIVDQLALVRTDGGTPAGQRYEAETAPAVCQGTIDSNFKFYKRMTDDAQFAEFFIGRLFEEYRRRSRSE